MSVPNSIITAAVLALLVGQPVVAEVEKDGLFSGPGEQILLVAELGESLEGWLSRSMKTFNKCREAQDNQ